MSEDKVLRYETNLEGRKLGSPPVVYRIVLREVCERIAETATDEDAGLIANVLNLTVATIGEDE